MNTDTFKQVLLELPSITSVAIEHQSVKLNGYSFPYTDEGGYFVIYAPRKRLRTGQNTRKVKIYDSDVSDTPRIAYLNVRLTKFISIEQKDSILKETLKTLEFEGFKVVDINCTFDGIEFAIEHPHTPHGQDWFIYDNESQNFTKVPNFFVPKQYFRPRTIHPKHLKERYAALRKHIDFCDNVILELEKVVDQL